MTRGGCSGLLAQALPSYFMNSTADLASFSLCEHGRINERGYRPASRRRRRAHPQQVQHPCHPAQKAPVITLRLAPASGVFLRARLLPGSDTAPPRDGNYRYQCYGLTTEFRRTVNCRRNRYIVNPVTKSSAGINPLISSSH